MKYFRIVTALAMIFGYGATAALAGTCGYQYCWGAVAIGPNGAWGWSQEMGNEQQAIDSALRGCKGNCDVFKTFYNTCGSIAVADNGGWGWGWHGDLETPKSIAMNYCMENGYNCEPRVWSCSY